MFSSKGYIFNDPILPLLNTEDMKHHSTSLLSNLHFFFLTLFYFLAGGSKIK